jgi:D-alanyl-D-alanine carboxypeptidase
MKWRLMATFLFTFALSAQPQQKMVRVGGPDEDRAKDWPKAVVRSGMSDAEVANEMKRYVGDLAARELFSGTVLVAKDGTPFLFESWGLASRDHGVPNTNDTKYNIGSITKTFTQVALAQLRDEGKIAFDKPLSAYLPDLGVPWAGNVTLLQLMTHTAGVPDIFGPEYQATPKNRIRELSDYLPLFIHKPLLFEPGTGNRYSNGGYVLLGLVIEKVSGMKVHDYFASKIYGPLGMKDSGAFEPDQIVPKRATGYMPGEKGLRINAFTLPGRASSAGGTYSTATDLLRFVTGARKVLTEASFERMIGSDPQVGWAGGSPGVNASVELNGPYTVIVLSNYDPPAAEEVSRNAMALLGRPLEP